LEKEFSWTQWKLVISLKFQLIFLDLV
jgi:hypothetical protein